MEVKKELKGKQLILSFAIASMLIIMAFTFMSDFALASYPGPDSNSNSNWNLPWDGVTASVSATYWTPNHYYQNFDVGSSRFISWPWTFNGGMQVHYWGNNFDIGWYQFTDGTMDYSGHGTNMGSTSIYAETKQLYNIPWPGSGIKTDDTVAQVHAS